MLNFDQSIVLLQHPSVKQTSTTDQHSEPELIRAICSGESDKFEILYSSYERQIFSYVFNMMNHHRQDTEDVCSAVWIKAYNKLNSFNGRHKFFSWIYSIARNSCYDALRKKKRKKQISSDDIETLERPVFHIEDLNATKEQLYETLKALKKEDKNLLVLRYIEDYKPKEIANILNLKVNQVSVRIHRAKQRAQNIIQSQYATTD